MKIEDVRKCSFPNWYLDFKHVTFKSVVIPLPDEFVTYILENGIILPKSAYEPVYDQNSSDSDIEDNWKNDINEVPAAEPKRPYFPDIDKRINDAIKELGGKVFPKLNWSSARDASWIIWNNSCCCTELRDIYLLLKSSNFIIHDITARYKLCEDYDYTKNDCNYVSGIPARHREPFYLVLRKFVEIDTSGEFRCFVKDGDLIGICQRDTSIYFDHIGCHKDEIIEDIVNFFQQHIESKFPNNNYVFDIYRKKKGKVYLIDFDPFGIVTESLLFSWDELKNGSVHLNENKLPEFRFVHDNHGIQPRDLRFIGMPEDVIDIGTGNDSFKLADLLKLKIDEQNRAFVDEEKCLES